MAGVLTIQGALNFCTKMQQEPAGDLSKPTRACAQIMLSGCKKCFQESADPNGNTWEPLKLRITGIAMEGSSRLAGTVRASVFKGRGLMKPDVPEVIRKWMDSRRGQKAVARFQKAGVMWHAKVTMGKPLLDTGQLQASLNFAVLGGDEVRLGSNLQYASAHQFGARINVTPAMRGYLHRRGIHLKKETAQVVIPARPFVGHRPENLPVYEGVYARHLGLHTEDQADTAASQEPA